VLLTNANRVLTEAQHKLEQVDTSKLSKDAERTIAGLNDTVKKMNVILTHVEGEAGLLASLTRASDAFGNTVRNADGVGGQVEEALQSVQEAARSIHKLADALEKDPDMLLKGRSRGTEKKR